MTTSIKQVLIISFIITLLVAVNSYAATLKITPATINITSNQPFTISIDIEDVVDLYGVCFDIIFDVDLLRVLNVEEGSFLKKGATQTQTSFLKQIDNQQGRVVFGITRLGSITGVSGSGTLATVILKPKSSGTTTLKLKNALLKNSQLNIIPTNVIDGLVNINLPPVVLQITPSLTEVLSNQTFTVTITAKDTIDLYGASFDFIFDADKLRVVKIEEGSFLKEGATQTQTSFLK